MVALLLALGSSVVLGLTDFLGGLKSRRLPTLTVLLATQVSALVAVAVGVLLLRAGPPAADALVVGALAGVGAAIGAAALYEGLAAGAIGIVAPVASTAPAVALVAGLAVGERPSALQGAGLLLALLGIVLAARPAGGGGRDVEPSIRRRSVAFGALAALGFGGSYVAVDAASAASVPWSLLSADIAIVGLFLAAAAVTRPRLAVGARDGRHLVGTGLLIAAADALYAVATTRGLLAVVAVLASLYPLVTVALARVHLGERVGRPQRLGMTLCLGGVALLSAGA